MQKLMPRAHLFAVIMAILAALGVFGGRAHAADRINVTVTGKAGVVLDSSASTGTPLSGAVGAITAAVTPISSETCPP